MLRALLDHPILRQARAAGERQVGRVLSSETTSAALQAVLAAAAEAKVRLDRAARAALDAAQVPSSRDLDELKRRLAEMEELLDGMSARLARAEAHEDAADADETPGEPPGPERKTQDEGTEDGPA
jgi:hypothetical protein